MDKREFLKTSGAMFASSFLPKLTTAQTAGESRTNWAGNYTYSTKNLDSANTIADVKRTIHSHTHLKAFGARHSFNGIADSTEDQVSLKHFDQIELDAKSKTVTVGSGVTYGQLAPYIDARDKDARKFEAVYLMLKNPGIRPFVETGFGRLTPVAKLDQLRDNWWCSLSMQGENYLVDYYRSRAHFSTPLAMLYGNSKPEAVFLPQADRTAAGNEWKRLGQIPAAPTFLSEAAVSYLKAHATEPRAAEALALAVRSTRYGCGDAGTSQQSQAAFRLLHSRYPNSDWAKKTKYWY